MGKLGEEVSEKIKDAIRAKLMELGVHIDNELPDYVMVLVANKKSQKQMDEDLTLFLGESTAIFTSWLYDVLKKLEQFTVSSKGMKRKIEEKKVKHKKSESDQMIFSKKVKLKSQSNSPGKSAEHYFDSEEISNSDEAFETFSEKTEEKEKSEDPQQSKYLREDEDERMGEDDDIIHLHDNNDVGCMSDRPGSSLDEKAPEEVSELINNVEKADKQRTSDKEEVIKPRERIKINWDNDNTNGNSSKRKSDNKIISDFKNKYYNEEKDREYNIKKGQTFENCIPKIFIKENEQDISDSVKNNEMKSSVRDSFGPKVVDARDIIKKKSLASKESKCEERKERHRRSRRSRDKGSKENHSSRLSSISKPIIREPEKLPTIPSMVKVTPRPVRPPGMQPSCNLILKAVADAEKSIATTKLTQKKIQTKNEQKEKKSANYRRTHIENISITLLNDRIVSNDIDSTDQNKNSDENEMEEDFEMTEPVVDILPSSTVTISESIEIKEEPSSTTNNGSFKTASTITEETQTSIPEPRFIITLDSTASDTEMEGDLDGGAVNEDCIKDCAEETLSVVRQPFDKSRLGPRLGPPVTETGDYRLFTIVEGNDSSQDLEMEQSELENGKSQTRCKYWPCCEAGSTCPYYHPTSLCRLFPACHFGDKCLYIHPACKFADKCLNTNCPYTHTSATPVVAKGNFKAPLPLSTANSQVCIFYPHCVKPFCPYIHIKKSCKFGSSCTKLSCEFEHPNKVITKNPYKWVANQ